MIARHDSYGVSAVFAASAGLVSVTKESFLVLGSRLGCWWMLEIHCEVLEACGPFLRQRSSFVATLSEFCDSCFYGYSSDGRKQS